MLPVVGFVLFCCLVGTIIAVPLTEKRADGPTVTLTRGTVVGSSLGGVDSFKGIPFAQPPLGPLRLKPPEPLTADFGTLTATGIPTACPQFYAEIDTGILPADVVAKLLNTPFLQKVTKAGEDCLTVNVQRPANTAADAKLPVVVWFFGGGKCHKFKDTAVVIPLRAHV